MKNSTFFVTIQSACEVSKNRVDDTLKYRKQVWKTQHFMETIRCASMETNL